MNCLGCIYEGGPSSNHVERKPARPVPAFKCPALPCLIDASADFDELSAHGRGGPGQELLCRHGLVIIEHEQVVLAGRLSDSESDRTCM